MGGNVKYRSRYVYYTDENGAKQVMRDSNGNPVKTGYPQYTDDGVRKLKSLNATRRASGATNARERMLNADAVKQFRDLARDFRVTARRAKKNGKYASEDERNAQRKILFQLAQMVNQVQPGMGSDMLKPNPTAQDARKAASEIEQVLGVKLT